MADATDDTPRPVVSGEELITPTEIRKMIAEAVTHEREKEADWSGRVALMMAATAGFALIIFTAAVVYDAVASNGPGLSSNATQVLTAAFSGTLGALSVYIGGRGSGRTGS